MLSPLSQRKILNVLDAFKWLTERSPEMLMPFLDDEMSINRGESGIGLMWVPRLRWIPALRCASCGKTFTFHFEVCNRCGTREDETNEVLVRYMKIGEMASGIWPFRSHRDKLKLETKKI